MNFPSEIDIAIIGAGAAGLAAARALENSALSVLVLEARDRLGGRGHTRLLPHKIIFDVGCEWLHSANRNIFVDIARDLDFEIDKTPPRWREQSLNIGFAPDDRRDFLNAMGAFEARVEAAAALPHDSPASQCLESGNRWNAQINSISTYINGCELNRVSVYDLNAYEDSGVNWRVKRGYGALIAAYGEPCPVALNTTVSLIDHSGTRIRIETSRGTLFARKVIITVPTNLLANETVRFLPALPEKIAAASGLPLGVADKVMLALDEPEALPTDGHLYGAIDRVGIGSYHLRPLGQPCISGFFGGKFARGLEDAGAGALAAQAIDELVALLGTEYRRKLKPIGKSRWAQDPFAQGAYSHALPDHANDRATLAQHVDNRLMFAGEATSANFFSTAHGAQETGVRAAQEAMEKNPAKTVS